MEALLGQGTEGRLLELQCRKEGESEGGEAGQVARTQHPGLVDCVDPGVDVRGWRDWLPFAFREYYSGCVSWRGSESMRGTN